MGVEYKVHTKLLTEFETLGVMGENDSGIIRCVNDPRRQYRYYYCHLACM